MHASVFLFGLWGNYIFFCTTTCDFLREDWFSCLFFSLFFVVADLLNCLNKVIAQDFFFFSPLFRCDDMICIRRRASELWNFLLSDVWKRNGRKDAPSCKLCSTSGKFKSGKNQMAPRHFESWFFFFFFFLSAPPSSSRRRHKSHLVEFKAKDNIE